jgi:phage gp29-like protein
MIEFVTPQGGSTGTSLHMDRANWLDQQMSKACLGQTTTTDAIGGGHAVSQEHREVQEDIERADARVLQAVLNRDLVRIWIDLEYGPQEKYPRLSISRPEEEDLTLLGTALPALVNVGLKVSQREVRAKFGLSEPEKGEDLLVPRAPTPAPRLPGELPPELLNPEGQRAPDATLHAEADETEDVAINRAIDALSDETGVLAAQSMDEVLNFIGSVVNESGSLEEVRSKLLKLAPEMPTKSLALALRQAQVVARLSGRASVMQDG